MRRLWIYLVVAVAAMAAACSRPDKFRITGEISGNPSTNLYIRYYGNGAVNTGVTAANEGHFQAEFSSVDPALVEILDNDRRVIGRLYLRNGDDVHVTIDRGNHANIQVEGREGINVEWSQVLNSNAEVLGGTDRQQINRLVEGYIARNPDNPVASLMFAAYYDCSADPLRADSVLSSIGEQGYLSDLLFAVSSRLSRYEHPSSYGPVGTIRYRVPRSDSTRVFDPKEHELSLLVVTNENSRRIDSVLPYLKEIYKEAPKRRLNILEFVMYPDSLSMRHAVSRDTVGWTQAWAPGSIFAPGLDELAIPSLPYYIVVDSAARQLYRGTSHAAARHKIKELMD